MSFQMASATTRPDKVMGMHFFSPAHIMKLLENIRGKDTSPETMATAMDLGKRMKKVSAVHNPLLIQENTPIVTGIYDVRRCRILLFSDCK